MNDLLLTTIAAVLLVECGRSVIIWVAAKAGNIEAIKRQLADGADVNVKDVSGFTLLDWVKGEPADLLRKHSSRTVKELKDEGNIILETNTRNKSCRGSINWGYTSQDKLTDAA